MRRKRREKTDWVFNRATYQADAPITLDVGIAGSVAASLVDSHNAIRVLKYGTSLISLAGAEIAGGGERPRQRVGDIIVEVKGVIFFTPDVWLPGSDLAVGCRVVAFDQNPEDGAFQPPTGYNMWGNISPTVSEDVWANGPPYLIDERRVWVYDGDREAPVLRMDLRWKGRWRMQQQQGLALYLELDATSAGARVSPFLGCRMVAP